MHEFFFGSPDPDAPVTFAGTVQDVIAAVVLVLFIPVALIWLPEIVGVLR